MYVLLFVIAWVLVGGLYARTQAVRLQKRVNKSEDHRKSCSGYTSYSHLSPKCAHDDAWWALTKTYQDDLRLGLLVHAIGWPIFGTGRLALRFADLLGKPVEKRRAEVAELIGRRDALQTVSHDPNITGDPLDAVKQSIAELDQQIKELTI